jgi:hypothetical protein
MRDNKMFVPVFRNKENQRIINQSIRIEEERRKINQARTHTCPSVEAKKREGRAHD